MYRRILIATDPEGLASQAAPAVASLAEPGADVLLMLVRRRGDQGEQPDAGEEALRRLFDDLAARGLSAHVQRRSGPVVEEIARAARSFDADLLVMGSHHLSDLQGLIHGSVGHRLTATLPTPILIVTGAVRRAVPVHRILVAVDGTARSQQAVRATVGLAPPDAEVTVLYVDTPVGGLGDYAVDLHPRPLPPAGREALGAALSVLREAGICAHERRVFSPKGPAAAIVREADDLDADVIVLGSRRPGRIGAVLVGSVAHDVVAQTRRAVLLAAQTPARQSPGVRPGTANSDP